MSVGSIIGAPLTAWLVVTCGWRWMFVLYALPGVLWAFWFASWYRNQPSEHPAVNAAERNLIEQGSVSTASTAGAVPWRLLLASPALWFLCLQQFCRAAGYIFFASWFATYLQEARGVTILGSGWLTTLPLLADVTGCMFGGVLSDAVLRRTGNARLARQGVSPHFSHPSRDCGSLSWGEALAEIGWRAGDADGALRSRFLPVLRWLDRVQ